MTIKYVYISSRKRYNLDLLLVELTDTEPTDKRVDLQFMTVYVTVV